MTIGIMGLGGVGGYLGGHLAWGLEHAAGSEARICFLARGVHLNAIQRHGLVLNTPQAKRICRPALATDTPEDLPLLDLVLVCVKSYDLLPLLESIKPKIHEQTVIIPLLNGVDIYERIRSVISVGVVLPACIYIGSHIEKPGVVTQSGGEGKILFGPDPRYPGYVPIKWQCLFDRAGVAYQWFADPYPAIWGKYLFIAAFGLITAFSGEPLGVVLEDLELKALTLGIMREIAALAARKSIRLEPAAIETAMEKARAFPFETKISYQRDIEAQKVKNEGDLFGDTILRLGRELGVDTSITRSIYQGLQRRVIRPA